MKDYDTKISEKTELYKTRQGLKTFIINIFYRCLVSSDPMIFISY